MNDGVENQENVNKRVAIYVRVSTKDKQDTKVQLQEIVKYLNYKGYQNYVCYEDKQTGINDDRKQYQNLMTAIRNDQYDLVIIWRLDRLFRHLRHLLNCLEEFTQHNVQIISLKESIDMSTPLGRVMVHMLGAFAEFEHSVTKERILSGFRRAQEEEILYGRTGRPGKKPIGRPRKEIDLNKLLELRKKNYSHQKIAKIMGTSKSKITRTLDQYGFKK